MASGRFMEEMMREHEQSLLEATLYDHIDDLLDFPKEDCAADVLLLDAPAPGSPVSARIIGAPLLPPMELPPPPPPAAAAVPVFFAAEAFGAKDCHIDPCEELDMDMAQLEWLSGLFDDASIPHEPAFNCAAPIKASAMGAPNAAAAVVIPDKLEDALFRSSSPTSVLEDNSFNNASGGAKNINNGGGGGSSASSSSSSSVSSCSESFSGSGDGRATWSAPVSPRPEPPILVIPARARSKRSRQSAFVRSAAPAAEPTILVPTPMYSSTSAHSDPESCNIAETNSQPPAMKKKKKAKKPGPPVTSDAEGDADADYEEGGGGSALPPGTVRRCTHCQIEKTPQWRAGPLGPKTLCNACGVRYKSGRLFPEYRPAASPTFVPAIHSNSHKKVVEMRQKVAPKGDDLLQYIRRRD